MKQLIGYLLTISILLSQDILTTKAGNVYEGNLISHTTGDVDFISKGVHHSLPTSMVQRLVLEDGRVLIREGKQFGKNSLTLEEYQKLSTKEKAIYDANLYNVKKWALYGPISTIIFGGCTLLYQWYDEGEVRKVDSGEWWESPIFLGGSSAASLSIPYLVLNNKEKFNFPKSILTDSEKEIYEQAYSKKLQKRKFKYAVGSFIVAGGCALIILSSFSLSGFDMGPQPPGPY